MSEAKPCREQAGICAEHGASFGVCSSAAIAIYLRTSPAPPAPSSGPACPDCHTVHHPMNHCAPVPAPSEAVREALEWADAMEKSNREKEPGSDFMPAILAAEVRRLSQPSEALTPKEQEALAYNEARKDIHPDLNLAPVVRRLSALKSEEALRTAAMAVVRQWNHGTMPTMPGLMEALEAALYAAPAPGLEEMRKALERIANQDYRGHPCACAGIAKTALSPAPSKEGA